MTTERTALDMALTEARDTFTLFSPTLPKRDSSVMAAFAAHTWAVDENDELIFNQTPRLAILGEKDSGKTTMGKLLKHMSRNGQIFGMRTATPAGLINAIREEHCTLIGDELDKLISRTGNAGAAIFEIVNTGYDCEGQTLNAVGFQRTFAPLVVIGKAKTFLGNPNMDTLRSRAIKVFMQRLPRKFGDEDGFDEYYHTDQVKAVGKQLSHAIEGVLDEILDQKPNMRGLTLRMRQIWRPLFQIAELAGGEWPDMIGEACRGSGQEATISPATQLRTDIASVVFRTEGNLSIEEIVRQLTQMKADSIDNFTSMSQATRAINMALAAVGLHAGTVWFNKEQAHGYKRDALEEAFKEEIAGMDDDGEEFEE
jgi:hypothetical protein